MSQGLPRRRGRALLRHAQTYNKLPSLQDQAPGIVECWLVRLVEADEVASPLLGLRSRDRYNGLELRRLTGGIDARRQARLPGQ